MRNGVRKITLNGKKVSFFGKIFGLMFKTCDTENLIFDFNRKTRIRIHSFFVFFDFLAVWVDENNKVVDFRIVKPFTASIKSRKPYFRLIEIPINERNKKIIRFFVGEGKI